MRMNAWLQLSGGSALNWLNDCFVNISAAAFFLPILGCFRQKSPCPSVSPAQVYDKRMPSHTEPVSPPTVPIPVNGTVGSAGAVADFVAGALGGVAICVITQPFDTVKVLMQSGRFTSPWACAKAVIQQSVRIRCKLRWCSEKLVPCSAPECHACCSSFVLAAASTVSRHELAASNHSIS